MSFSLFSTPAFAQTATPAAGAAAPGGILSMLPLLLIFVVFYFLIIRPQTKKMKEHQAMIQSLRRGDKVVTSGGILGTVQRVLDDGNVIVEIAPDVKVTVVKTTISSVEGKNTLLKDDLAAEKSAR